MKSPEAVVAGHICLDIIPTIEHSAAIEPGRLTRVGPAVISTGGAVSNTGLALRRLGVRTRLIGKVGDDAFGRIIREIAGSDGMIVARGETSSYTVVINPPNVDRAFLHCPGANDTFRASDVTDEALHGAKLFHFGYPPIMRRMYLNEGRELVSLFRRVKRLGLTTSLDMVMVDPKSEAGRVDWAAVLRRVLPYVDIFLPSLDEMQVMLGERAPDVIAAQLCKWGAKIAGLKLGSKGLYVRWPDKERSVPCFKVKVVGTTGAGDATIAGFLAAYLRGLPPDEVMTMAVAVGACCCEAADAVSGIRPWEQVRARIAAGWPRLK
ncbi:MAG: PfkB family carbohydrate kinase [Verrucomicrobiae bacterium]|nr:PfkB family carbohydrate kinase [Verrucomicrobiae bacterium]